MLKAWLKENNWRQAHLCDRLGLSAGFISELVNGDKRPSIDVAMRIHLLTGGSVSLPDWFSKAEIAAFQTELSDARPSANSGAPMREAI